MSAAGLRRAALCGPLLLGLITGTSAEGLMQREPWEGCYYCHGERPGSGTPAVPVIHGQPAAYLARQLQDFRDGRRLDPNRMMGSALALLTDGDLQRVATHFSRLPRPAPAPAAAESIGARLFRQGRPGLAPCADCHAETPDAGSRPYLHGQGRAYLSGQLRAFRDGRRRDEGGLMRDIAGRLNDREIAALVDYLAGDQRPIP